MKSSFTQLLAEQHQAIAVLETAMEKLFDTEKSLIEENPKLPVTARARSREAALELVQLVVDQKLKSLAFVPEADQPVDQP